MSRLQPEIHPLLTKGIVDTLRLKQICSVLDFIKADTQQIIKTARLNFREVLTVKNFLLKKFSARPTNGFDCYKTTLNNTAIIPTGIEGVDSLLDGGLVTGNIYEICGHSASGKTHFVMSLTRNVAQNMVQKVYIFDTKNDVSATKMKHMLSGYDQEKRRSLGNVLINHTYTKYDLINGLYQIRKELQDNNLKLRLIVIDSLPCLLLNSNDYVTNNVYLNHLANVMRYISVEHQVAFLITNLITTWNENNFNVQKGESLETVACGKYWFTIPNTRLKIEKSNNLNLRKISILNSDILNRKINTSSDILFADEGFL